MPVRDGCARSAEFILGGSRPDEARDPFRVRHINPTHRANGRMSNPVSPDTKVQLAEAKLTAPARLKQRADFLHVGRGIRVHVAVFSLQASKRRVAEADPAPLTAHEPRIGFTVTKKVGGAVERNRIRRRMREALRHAKALPTAPDTDYVIVARREALSVPFKRLISDLEQAVHKAGLQLSRPRGPGKPSGARRR